MFRTYYEPLCGYANKLIQDLDEAEEVVQTIFFKFWERKEGLDITVSVKAYLYRSVHNACLNHLKHTKVRQEHASHVKATHSEAVDDRTLEQKELSEKINEAVAELPVRCREVFTLNKMEGLKYREVAELLDISEKTVENQMGKALKILRQKLVQYIRILIPWLLFFFTGIGGNGN